MPIRNRRNTIAKRRTELSSRERYNKTRKSNKNTTTTVNRRNAIAAAMVAARSAYNAAKRQMNKTRKVSVRSQ